jgi:Fe2+ or Zn2+ uptake regulation protein
LRVIAGHVEANPGATAPEIAEATSIDRAVVYSALSRMTTNGRLTKNAGGDGKVTYEVARTD